MQYDEQVSQKTTFDLLRFPAIKWQIHGGRKVLFCPIL